MSPIDLAGTSKQRKTRPQATQHSEMEESNTKKKKKTENPSAPRSTLQGIITRRG